MYTPHSSQGSEILAGMEEYYKSQSGGYVQGNALFSWHNKAVEYINSQCLEQHAKHLGKLGHKILPLTEKLIAFYNWGVSFNSVTVQPQNRQALIPKIFGQC